MTDRVKERWLQGLVSRKSRIHMIVGGVESFMRAKKDGKPLKLRKNEKKVEYQRQFLEEWNGFIEWSRGDLFPDTVDRADLDDLGNPELVNRGEAEE